MTTKLLLLSAIFAELKKYIKIRSIYAFPKGISTKWNANNIVQNLISGHRFNFLRI